MTGAGPRILVVDDEKEVRSLIRSILGEAGFAVTVAPDGETALTRIAATRVDLAIVDLRLPGGLDGCETMRRARLQHSDLKALFVANVGERPQLLDLARNDLVYKPFSSREFLGCVFELLLRGGDTAAPTGGRWAADPWDDAAGGRSYRLAAEEALAEARRGCLRRRRAAALRAGDRGLAAELAHELDERSARARGSAAGDRVADATRRAGGPPEASPAAPTRPRA